MVESLVPVAAPLDEVEFASAVAPVEADAVEAADAAAGGAAHALLSLEVAVPEVALEAAEAEPVEEAAPAPVPEAAPPAEDAPALPAASLVVKLVKPFAAMTSATLFPVASKGV